MDALLDASGILGTIGHVVRCDRVSGLEVAACHAPRACMEIWVVSEDVVDFVAALAV